MSEQADGQGVKVMGIVAIILGVLAMMTPLLTGMAVVMLIGALVLVGGIVRIVWAFKAGSVGRGIFMFLIGGLTFVCGVVMLANPLLGAGLLTILLAIYLVMDGLVEIAAGVTGAVESGRGFLIFAGVLSLILGVLIWRQFPLSGPWALGIFLGIKLFLIGIAMLTVRRAVQEQMKASA
jgi:uncharacterized membrane protein HdeD (DUF308 family)